MNHRQIAAALGLMLALAPAHAGAQLTARAPLSFGPATPGETAHYKISMQYRLSSEQPAPAADQDVSFTLVDATHMTVATGEGATAESVVADRGSDGRLKAKLKRGSLLYWPMQIFNKLESVTAVASATAPGEIRSGAIPLAESNDSIPGSLRITRASDNTTDAIVEAAGQVQPRELPRGAIQGKPLAPPEESKSGLNAGGMEQGSKPPANSGPIMGDAVLRLRATYIDGPMIRAESVEVISLAGASTITITRRWSLNKA